MILAQENGEQEDQRPLGRTVQLLRRLHDMGRMDRIVTASRIDILSGIPEFVCCLFSGIPPRPQRLLSANSALKALPQATQKKLKI
jgi:hypothetical protein